MTMTLVNPPGIILAVLILLALSLVVSYRSVWMRLFGWIRKRPQQPLPHGETGGFSKANRFTRCLHCHGTQFYEGPEGGLSINLECAECGARYNVFRAPGGPYLDMEIRPPS